MSIFLWILQGLLALHTVIGAGWKLFNSEHSIPTLAAIPHAVWMILIPFEVICAVALILPAMAPSTGWLVPLAAIGIAAEMVVFSGIHMGAGAGDNGPMFFWIGVAAFCAVIAAGRWMIAPL